jgi:RNA polymerase sigma-70 factor, ECF subfamily
MAEQREDSENGDEELLRAIRGAPEGDLRAFEKLVERYQSRILANCRYLTRDEANAEDLAQEVFVKIFFGLRGFEGRSSLKHWIQRIKIHHCLNHLKKREGKEIFAFDEEAVAGSARLQVPPVAEQEIAANEDRERIDSVLNAMPATLRVPLIMADMDDLSYEEIASSLDVGLSAAKMRIKRARELFRRLYSARSELGRGVAR